MFSQKTINTVVGIDIVLGIMFVAAIAIYSSYRYADYLLFVHRLNKHAKRDNRKDLPTIVKLTNPECFYGMFCKVIKDLALGKYKDQFKDGDNE